MEIEKNGNVLVGFQYSNVLYINSEHGHESWCWNSRRLFLAIVNFQQLCYKCSFFCVWQVLQMWNGYNCSVYFQYVCVQVCVYVHVSTYKSKRPAVWSLDLAERVLIKMSWKPAAPVSTVFFIMYVEKKSFCNACETDETILIPWTRFFLFSLLSLLCALLLSNYQMLHDYLFSWNI